MKKTPLTSGRVPLYFGREDRPLFGWLHEPSGAEASASARLGLIVCNPFGYEAICAHRSLRHFAEAAAAANIPALRFDYDGTGDSAGDDRDPDRLGAWIESIRLAIDFMTKNAGVSRVALLGVRLGALLAVKAAMKSDELAHADVIDSIVAIAPVVSGRTYLREIRALQAALQRGAPPSNVVQEEGVQEALGFAITAETQGALGGVDLTKLDAAPNARAVLLIDRDDLTTSSAWPDRLKSQGVLVEQHRLAGYTEMMLGPQEAEVPEAMVALATTWLSARADLLPPNPTTKPAPAWRERAQVAPNVVESPEIVDRDGRLFGVLAMPASEGNGNGKSAKPSGRRGLLLLNAGSVHHIGSNRLYVALARRWAALGHVVLRMDIAGIGDSRPRPGEPENIVYTDGAVADVAEGIAFLRRQKDVVEVHALGLCSGGYHAFKAAVGDVRLDGVVLINPLTFFYKPGMPLEAAPHLVTGEATRYTKRLHDLEAWKKLFRGEVHVKAAANVFARRLGNIVRDRARDVARRAGVRVADDLAFELQSVAKKKVALRFLFAAGDPGQTLLASQGGATVKKLAKRRQLGIDVIEGPDHTFTPLWSHPLFIKSLADLFDAPARVTGPARDAD